MVLDRQEKKTGSFVDRAIKRKLGTWGLAYININYFHQDWSNMVGWVELGHLGVWKLLRRYGKVDKEDTDRSSVGYNTFAYYVILMSLAWLHINMEIYSMVHL